MSKKCRSCGFENPGNVNNCLSCGKKLPESLGEAKDEFQDILDLAQGKVEKVGKKRVRGLVDDKVDEFKYKHHPKWVLKTKAHRLKRNLITFFWILVIIGGVVIFGLIYNFISKLFKGG